MTVPAGVGTNGNAGREAASKNDLPDRSSTNHEALTGCGAFVSWMDSGRLSWKIKSLRSTVGIAACNVASKDHVVSAPASISGYAIGMRGF